MNRMLATLLLALVTCSACSTSGQVGAHLQVEAADGLSIAFIGDIPLSSASKKEQKLILCVVDAMHKHLPSLKTVPSDVLLKALYPLASSRADALDPLSLMLLRDDPVARERVGATGVRYVIALSGESALVGAERIANPILSGLTIVRRSAYSADVYDVVSGQVTSTASAQAEATGGFGIGLIPPFLYIVPPFTHSRACDRLGAVVVEALGGPAAPKD